MNAKGEDQVLLHVAAGRLVPVLEDWCPLSPAIICIVRAVGSNRLLSHYWWMFSGIAAVERILRFMP